MKLTIDLDNGDGAIDAILLAVIADLRRTAHDLAVFGESDDDVGEAVCVEVIADELERIRMRHYVRPGGS